MCQLCVPNTGMFTYRDVYVGLFVCLFVCVCIFSFANSHTYFMDFILNNCECVRKSNNLSGSWEKRTTAERRDEKKSEDESTAQKFQRYAEQTMLSHTWKTLVLAHTHVFVERTQQTKIIFNISVMPMWAWTMHHGAFQPTSSEETSRQRMFDIKKSKKKTNTNKKITTTTTTKWKKSQAKKKIRESNERKGKKRKTG